MITISNKSSKYIEIAFHIIIWTYIFISPLLFKGFDDKINWQRYYGGIILPIFLCIIFYLNYFYLVPQFLYSNLKSFILINAIIIITCALGERLIMDYQFLRNEIQIPTPSHIEQATHTPKSLRPLELYPPKPRFPHLPKWIFMVRNIFIMIITITFSSVVSISRLWRKSKEALKEAELGRTEAELKNLRNQINPHFLLNTLNNIYALTEFDIAKAQKAIQELGKLLRYILYENQQELVALSKEIEFLDTYIKLMEMRVQENVDIKVNFEKNISNDIQVAPLIFISLIENAFKHGISPTKPSFIHLKLTIEENGDIRFTAINSNYPKSREDKAGSGIGLQQVKKRLEITYKKRFDWYYGADKNSNTYLSSIIIYKTK